MSDLSIAKKKLSESLGDGMDLYLQNLKAWFKQKITKEEFDFESRRMLKPEAAHLHNEFLLAMFTKCQCFPVVKDVSTVAAKTTGHKALKLNISRSNFQQRFSAVNPLSYAPQGVMRNVNDDIHLGFCSRDMTLPDSLLSHGRMFVIAWENGLEDIHDDTVAMVIKATEYHLKNILSAVMSLRHGYKLREGRYKYAMGVQAPNLYLRQTSMLHDYTNYSEATSVSGQGSHIASLRPSPDLGEEEMVRRLACVTDVQANSAPISLNELLQSLQLYKNTIPSHTIYATNIERIIHSLWHPSNEDVRRERQPTHSQRTKRTHASVRTS